MSIYACSDLHGQYTLFIKLLNKINFSNNDTMYVLGDIIDRGPKNIRLLKYIKESKNIISILGNHEHMMHCWYTGSNRELSKSYMLSGNGGKRTRKQFLSLNKKEQQQLIDYIENMYLQYEITENNKKYLLSHSSFLTYKNTIKWKDAYFDEIFKVLWHSPWRFDTYEFISHYENDLLYNNRIHVVGHVPTQKVYGRNTLQEIEYPSLINIDGGCAYKSNHKDIKAGVICMNITKHSLNKKDCFTYIN